MLVIGTEACLVGGTAADLDTSLGAEANPMWAACNTTDLNWDSDPVIGVRREISQRCQASK